MTNHDSKIKANATPSRGRVPTPMTTTPSPSPSPSPSPARITPTSSLPSRPSVLRSSTLAAPVSAPESDPLSLPKRAHTYAGGGGDDDDTIDNHKNPKNSTSHHGDTRKSPSDRGGLSGNAGPPRRTDMDLTSGPYAGPAPVVAMAGMIDDRSRDAFESSADNDEVMEATRASIELDDLPIELVSLTDSFIESLFAKVHSAPPNVDNLTRLFQEFYATASSHIQTHVSALATRASRSRDASPASRTSSAASRLRAKAASLGSKDRPGILGGMLSGAGGGSSSGTNASPADVPETSASAPPSSSGTGAQQMLTADELATRKRARKTREQNRVRLEEAIERRLCEGLYDRIYRHRSTQDEAQDEKLRSKTAALALVGIGPAELCIVLGREDEKEEEAAARVDEVKTWLEGARGHLARMYEKRYPLGKLNLLKAAHKSIVETLSHFHPSASADEIMPMLIYTLITMPPENLNVISDFLFVQRFRWEAKLTGEAAYCLTNLEAAIRFLETVDLSTLRADEHPSGPAKAAPPIGAAGTKTAAETFPPAFLQGLSIAAPAPSQAAAVTSTVTATAAKPTTRSAQSPANLSVPPPHTRRISDFVQTPAQAINAASDAVFNTADQGLRTISNSLDASYKFFFGRLMERHIRVPPPATAASAAAAAAAALASVSEAAESRDPDGIVVPKTLDDARKLVSTPPLVSDDDDRSVEDLTGTTAAAAAAESMRPPPPREDRVLNLIGGWRPARDHSADSIRSTRSAHSLRKVLFAADDSKEKPAQAPTGALAGAPAFPGGSAAAAPASGSSNPAIVESMRNLGNSLNPMARLSGLGMIRGFGRSSPGPVPTTPAGLVPKSTPDHADGTTVALPESTTSSVLPSPNAARIRPPITRFLDVADAGDLRLAEVADLLRDYRRLAGALKDFGAY